MSGELLSQRSLSKGACSRRQPNVSANGSASLLRHLKDRYRDILIGAVVAVGAATVELVLRWRSELWPAIPVMFAMVDEIDFARLRPPAGLTGTIVKIPLADSIKGAHALVPGLETVVFIGDIWDRLAIYRNWKEEIPTSRSHEASFRCTRDLSGPKNRSGGGVVFHLFFSLAFS